MFSNITDAWNHDPVKEMTDKLSRGAFRNSSHDDEHPSTNDSRRNTRDVIKTNLSEDNSLSLLSDNTLNFTDSDFGSFTPINFNKKQTKNRRPKHYDSDTNSSQTTNSSDDSDCSYSVKHLKKCTQCNDKIKKIISTKVNKKFDEMILDNKIKQLQSAVGSQIQTYQPLVSSNTNNESWKQLLIIVVAAVIIIFVIFLMAKTLNK